MSKSELKLVKLKKKRGKIVAANNRRKRDQALKSQEGPALTPAEESEAERFKALTAAKAAQQAMLRRIMAEISSMDDISPAA